MTEDVRGARLLLRPDRLHGVGATGLRRALYRLRAAQGVLGLRKKYGDARLEAACRKAITVGDPSYRTVKGILVAGTETETETETDPEPETGDAGAAAFLHGPEGLFAAVPTQTPGDSQDDQDCGCAQEAVR